MINTYMTDPIVDNISTQIKSMNFNMVNSINCEIDVLRLENDCLKIYLSILDPKFFEIYNFIQSNKYLIESDSSVLEAYIRKLKIENIITT